MAVRHKVHLNKCVSRYHREPGLQPFCPLGGFCLDGYYECPNRVEPTKEEDDEVEEHNGPHKIQNS